MMLGAGDPRDQVYALLSLASDSAAEELQPNYKSEVSNNEIFTKYLGIIFRRATA
jgi:hypothetical protein